MRTTFPGADYEGNGRNFRKFETEDIGRLASGAVLRDVGGTPDYESLMAQKAHLVPVLGGQGVLRTLPFLGGQPEQSQN